MSFQTIEYQRPWCYKPNKETYPLCDGMAGKDCRGCALFKDFPDFDYLENW